MTICAKDNRCVFSQIEDAEEGAVLRLTQIGMIADRCWNRMNAIAPHIKTDYYCIMPNHIHGIIVIEDHPKEAARSIPDLIHAYKSAVTREANRIVPTDRKTNFGKFPIMTRSFVMKQCCWKSGNTLKITLANGRRMNFTPN